MLKVGAHRKGNVYKIYVKEGEIEPYLFLPRGTGEKGILLVLCLYVSRYVEAQGLKATGICYLLVSVGQEGSGSRFLLWSGFCGDSSHLQSGLGLEELLTSWQEPLVPLWHLVGA